MLGSKTTIIPTKGFEKKEDARREPGCPAVAQQHKKACGFRKEINQMWVPLLRVMLLWNLVGCHSQKKKNNFAPAYLAKTFCANFIKNFNCQLPKFGGGVEFLKHEFWGAQECCGVWPSSSGTIYILLGIFAFLTVMLVGAVLQSTLSICFHCWSFGYLVPK